MMTVTADRSKLSLLRGSRNNLAGSATLSLEDQILIESGLHRTTQGSTIGGNFDNFGGQMNDRSTKLRGNN